MQGIPFANLVSDPNFLQSETIRSFYVDQNWFRVFVDGALSICEHFGENDDVREAMKKSINKFLNTPLDSGPYKGFVPQVPKWGLLLRSEFVSKFPDMRISAPFDTDAKQKAQLEVLRQERIDNDLMLVLFDREPGDFSNLGISLSPPEHQLTSLLGDDDGLNAQGLLTLSLKPVFPSISAAQQQSNYIPSRRTIQVNPTVVGDYFDSNSRALFPDKFAADVTQASGFNLDQYGRGGIVAAHLIAAVPSLNLLKPGATRTNAGSSAVVTSRNRQPVILRAPAQEPKVPRSVPTDALLSAYPAPVNPMIQAVARVDMLPQRDGDLISNFFKFPTNRLQFNVPQQRGPPSFSSRPRNSPYIDGQQALLSTVIYNLRYNNSVNPDVMPYQTALVGLWPQSLGFKTDLVVETKSLATTRNDLSKLSIQLPIAQSQPGSTPSCILAPLPTNQPANTLAPNADGEWPAQPVLNAPKTNGYILPRIRMVGLSQRWWAKASYNGPANGRPAYLNIEIRPNNKSSQDYPIVPAWDISRHKEISFVVEGKNWHLSPLLSHGY